MMDYSPEELIYKKIEQFTPEMFLQVLKGMEPESVVGYREDHQCCPLWGYWFLKEGWLDHTVDVDDICLDGYYYELPRWCVDFISVIDDGHYSPMGGACDWDIYPQYRAVSREECIAAIGAITAP